jgi:MOSC domain-containing protein YiiM
MGAGEGSGVRRLDGMSLHEQEVDVSGLALRGEVVSVSRNDAYSFSKPIRDEIVLIPGLGVEGDVHAGVTVKHRSRVRADPTQPNLRQVHLIHAELHDDLRPEGYEVPPGGLGENVTTTGVDLLKLPRGTVLRFGPPPSPPPGQASPPESSDAAGSAVDEPAPIPGQAIPGQAIPGQAIPGQAASSAAAAVVAAARATTLDEASAAAVAALADRIQAEQAASGTHPALGTHPAHDTRPAIIVTGLRNPCQQINGYRSGLLRQVLGRDDRGNLVRKAGVMAVVLRGGAVRPGDAVSVDLPERPHLPLDRV